jgi:hypothetical protein
MKEVLHGGSTGPFDASLARWIRLRAQGTILADKRSGKVCWFEQSRCEKTNWCGEVMVVAVVSESWL